MPGTDAVPRVYLDACIAIYLVERHPDHAQSPNLAAAIESGCEQFWTHDSRLAAAARGILEVIDFSS
jgi:hypothetical protein